MSHAATAVALLFDDAELGGHLRDALNERGARIVHEGGMASLSRDLLNQVGAQVLVVNLDDSADDALDRLYEVIDGDQPRVVFNDAQASRALTGWDRARWARHLAVKVLEMGDLDPPRPEHARGVEVINSDVLEAAIVREAAAQFVPEVEPDPHPADDTASTPERNIGAEHIEHAEHTEHAEQSELTEHASVAPETPSFSSDASAEAGENSSSSLGEPSDDLAAELEALLASGDLSMEDDAPTGSGLRFTGDEDLPPLHDAAGVPARSSGAGAADGHDGDVNSRQRGPANSR
jgi:chemosensory pili system protein ChpB (putative protein-glutamate methylesterase)